MRKTLEVRGRDDAGVLAASLNDLLSLLPEWRSEVPWQVFEIEAVTNESFDVGSLSYAAEQSARGRDLRWSELQTLADAMVQPINIILAASDGGDVKLEPPIGPRFYDRCVPSASLHELT